MNPVTCSRCQETFWLSSNTHATLVRTGQSFHCPWGHVVHFPLGPTEADKLRLERDRLAQQIAEKNDELDYQRRRRQDALRSASAFKGQVTRLRNRAAAGVCPCCNRSFQNLRRHMASKHAGFSEAPDLGATVQ